MGGFYLLLNKVIFYECVEVKGKILMEGEILGYWDLTDMSMFFVVFIKFVPSP